jgi:hypothetical protein
LLDKHTFSINFASLDVLGLQSDDTWCELVGKIEINRRMKKLGRLQGCLGGTPWFWKVNQGASYEEGVVKGAERRFRVVCIIKIWGFLS